MHVSGEDDVLFKIVMQVETHEEGMLRAATMERCWVGDEQTSSGIQRDGWRNG